MWTLFGFEATPPAQSGPATPTQAGPAPREVLDAAAACADFAAKLALLDEECRRSAAARRRAPLEAADAAWAAAAAALGEEDLVAASLAPFIAMDVDSDDEACGDAAAGDEAAELLPPAPDDCMMVDDAADADGGADDADREAFGSDSDGFEKVPGLDVGALAALVRAGEAAVEAARDKDVVVLLGSTGSGKTTSVVALAGREMVRRDDEQLGVVFEAREPLEGLEIGHSKESQTKHLAHHVRGEFVYIDTPGLEDTAGPAPELALAIGIQQLVRVSRSMRFVVVVNCASLQSERGGPMRSVAAFCSNLVGDKFGTHQDAFTFLFTHAVKFLPGAGRGGAAPFDAGAARRSLVRELEQVLKGAGEREVREVIACLLTALRAESGRCDVFDPVESDVEAVVRSIEQAACAIAEPEVHVQSALTLKAVLLLKNKLHAVHDAAALQLGGRAAFRLRAGAYDALAIECRAVRDLATATDRKFVRDAATRLDTLIAYEAAATAQALREIVARDLENGASPGHFCRGRRRLHALDGIVDEAGGGGGHGAVVDLDVSEALRALERSVEAELSKPRGPDCGVVLRAVLVLEAWAAAVGAGGGARGLITEYVCGIVAALAVAGAAADLAYVARGLEHVRRARDGGFCADNPALGRRVDASCKAAFRTLRRGVRGLEQAAAVAAAAAFAGKPGPLATTMGALKAVCAEGGGSARDTLVGPAYDAATAVTEMVFDAFEARVGVVQRLVEAPALNGALLEACIASLAAVADAMERGGPPSPDDCDGGDEAALAMRTVPRRFRVQQQRARAFLERRLTDDAARVDYCCQALEAHGIVGDAAGHAASLETLAACAWFDADRLAQLASFVDRYVTHCHGVVLEAFTAVADGLECCDAERVLASRDARTLAVEALFTGVYARLLRAASEVIARRWCRSEQATVEDAARLAASDDATSMMRSVDVVRMGATLGVAYVLRGLQLATAPRDRADDGHYADDGAVAAVTAVCLKRLDAQRDGAWALVEEKGRWPAKSALLDAARRWDGCGVSPPLPHFDELKRRFVQRLDERAARLEKLIQASADCDDAAIVDGIKGLRDVAALVDAPLDSAPSNHVAGLESLLEAKRAGIDSALERRCREDNFGEMAKYLVPFARSTDAAQLDKLGRYQKLLVARLNELVCSLRAQLESGAAVAEIMPKLRAARASGIGDLLAPAFDVDAAVGAIEADVDAQVSRDLAALEAALDAGEFPQVLRRFDAFRAFHDAARPLLEAGHVATYDSLAPQAASSLDDVRGLVKPFVEALSSHGDGDPEPRTYAAAASGSSGGYRGGYRARGGVAPSASRVLATTVATKAAALHRALETLRTAVDEPDVDGRIAACYRDVTTSLRTELNALNRQLLKRVESQHLYTHAIDVLTALETEWCQEGLDRHIQLDVDIQACLEDLRLRRSQRDDDVRVGLICATDEKVAATAAKLDSLSEKSSLFGIIRSSQRPADRREYYRLLNIAKGVVDNIVERAFVCFEDENFELLAESTNNLARIEAALGKHVGDHVCGALKCVNTPHLALVTKMQAGVVQALDGGAFERFESLFGTFCEVVLHCTAATAAACAGARRALHAAVERYVDAQLALLEEQLRVHAYADVRDSVLRWRHLALFMAIPFALYLSRARALDAEGASGGATGGAKGAAAALRDDAGLALLQRRYDYHFGDVLKVGRFYAVLGVRHDAPAEALEAAFRQTALKAHPDKHRGRGAAAERAATVACQALNEAHNELAKAGVRARFEERLERLSSNQRITRVLTGLRETLQRALVDGEYEPAASLLFRSGDLDVVAPLAWPVLDSNSLRAELFRLARAHVESIRVNVEHHWQARNFDALHDDFGRFDAAVRHLAQFEGVCTESWCAQVEDYIDVEIAGIASGALVMMRTLSEPEAFDQMHEFALLLVRVGRILDGLPRFKDIARLKLSQMLNACANNRWGFGYVYKLGLLLERGDVTELAGDDRVAKVIVAEMVHFKDILTMVWNEEVVQKPAAVAVGEIDAFRHVAGRPQQPLNVDRPRLLEQLELCEREYVTNLRTYLVPGADLDALVRGTTALAAPLRPCRAWTPQVRALVPALLGRVFAFFTILKSGDSFNRLSAQQAAADDADDGAVDGNAVLLKPHSIQLLAVLRLLGCDDARAPTGLASHVMQIRTGEGKSMVLGACATVLALLGYRVRCVCYSEYLSARDDDLFQPVFAAFGVEGGVTYSKIDQMSEDAVAARGNIRDLTLRLIDGPSAAAAPSALAPTTLTQHAPAPLEVLLVDEVDVFFGRDFYGQTYNQVASLEDAAVRAILTEIWRQRQAQLSVGDVKGWTEYRELAARLRGWAFLVDAEIAAMVCDVRQFDEPAYHCDKARGRIGYTVHDAVDWSLAYGYRTAFAFLAEAEKGGFHDAPAALRRGLGLRVMCGRFSYANIAPHAILGVSGTLSALSPRECDVLSTFGIDTYTHVPSVYGASNLRFDAAGRGIVVEKERSGYFPRRYFQALTQAMNLVTDDGRAVIVFFADEDRLAEYRGSPFWAKVRGHKSELTSKLSRDERNYVIKKATTRGYVTLATAVFGRGTDFFCKDRRQDDAEGAHIIQAFLSVEKAEEVQIRGRTARQGKRGSYGLVLLESDLDDLGIPAGTCANVAHGDLYGSLDRARTLVLDARLDAAQGALAEACKLDDISRNFIDALVEGRAHVAKALLADIYDLAKTKAAVPVSCHILLDVSGSMLGQPLADAKAGIAHIVTNVLDAGRGDTFSLTAFSNGYYEHLVDVSLSDKAAILRTVDGLQVVGGTALYAAFHRKLGDVVQRLQPSTKHYLFVFTDGADTSNGAMYGPLKAAIDNIPEDALTCALASVGLAPQAQAMLTALADTGKLKMHTFATPAEIHDAFEHAAHDIIELVGGHTATA